MNIKIVGVRSRELDELLEMVYARAEAHGIRKEDAIRQALEGWLEHHGESGDRLLVATPAELTMIEAVLAAVRSYPDSDRGSRPV